MCSRSSRHVSSRGGARNLGVGHARGLVDRARLDGLRLPAAARRIRDLAEAYADSGLETPFQTRLRWLKVRILRQIWIAGHRVDHLIGERLVVQVDGGYHVGAQRDEDIAHDARLRLLGYTVFRVSYRQIVHDWPAVQDLVTQAVAQGLHRSR